MQWNGMVEESSGETWSRTTDVNVIREFKFRSIPLVPADDPNVFLSCSCCCCCFHCTRTIASTVRLNLTSNQAAAATAAKEEEKVFRVVFYTFDSVEHHLATWDVG